MTIAEIFSLLEKKDVLLFCENGNLKFSAPRGIFTPDLRRLVTDHKPEILEFLKSEISKKQKPENLKTGISENRESGPDEKTGSNSPVRLRPFATTPRSMASRSPKRSRKPTRHLPKIK